MPARTASGAGAPAPHEVYRRRAGEVIDPQREDRVVLDQVRRTLGSMNFAAQYQQNPVPPDGNAIRREWLRYYDVPPPLDLVMASWDTAFTLGEASDYSVGTVWGLKGSDIYLLDVVRGRFEVPDLRRRIEATTDAHGAHATLIEETDIGRAILQEMRLHSHVRPMLWRVQFDKEARLLGQAPKFEAGQVLLPAAWCTVVGRVHRRAASLPQRGPSRPSRQHVAGAGMAVAKDRRGQPTIAAGSEAACGRRDAAPGGRRVAAVGGYTGQGPRGPGAPSRARGGGIGWRRARHHHLLAGDDVVALWRGGGRGEDRSPGLPPLHVDDGVTMREQHNLRAAATAGCWIGHPASRRTGPK
jgi:predicted phage terminase large subunit-like protein